MSQHEYIRSYITSSSCYAAAHLRILVRPGGSISIAQSYMLVLENSSYGAFELLFFSFQHMGWRRNSKCFWVHCLSGKFWKFSEVLLECLRHRSWRVREVLLWEGWVFVSHECHGISCCSNWPPRLLTSFIRDLALYSFDSFSFQWFFADKMWKESKCVSVQRCLREWQWGLCKNTKCIYAYTYRCSHHEVFAVLHGFDLSQGNCEEIVEEHSHSPLWCNSLWIHVVRSGSYPRPNQHLQWDEDVQVPWAWSKQVMSMHDCLLKFFQNLLRVQCLKPTSKVLSNQNTHFWFVLGSFTKHPNMRNKLCSIQVDQHDQEEPW